MSRHRPWLASIQKFRLQLSTGHEDGQLWCEHQSISIVMSGNQEASHHWAGPRPFLGRTKSMR